MSSTAFEQFDRIEDAVLTLESEAAATAELGAEGFLGWEAADLEDPDVAEELQALKVTMGLAPAPAAETASAEETESAVEVTVEAEPAPAPSS